MAPVKADKHDAMVIAIDCGATMADEESPGITYFELAKEILDWIVSRKIFSMSKDKINIASCCAPDQPKTAEIRLFNEIYQNVSFDHLQFIKNEVTLHSSSRSLGVPSLLSTLNSMIQHIDENKCVLGKSVILISRTFADPTPQESKQLDEIKETMNNLGISLTHIGGCENDNSSGMNFLKTLIQEVDGNLYGFRGVGSVLEQFSHPSVVPRSFRKYLEIAPGVKLPFSMFVRVTEAKTPLKKCLIDGSGVEFKRQTTFSNKDENVSKEDHVYGYAFGGSKVVVDPDIEKEMYKNHNFNENEKGGSLKLIQFSPLDNILPSYLIGNSSYIIVPGFDKKTALNDLDSMKVSASLISGMLKDSVVAICRYAPDVSKHISLMCLIPQHNEQSGFHFQGVKLPFFEDWRSYTLPTFDSMGNTPNGAQLQLVDELIDSMNLKKTNFDNEVIPNPHFQRECMLLKQRALEQPGEIAPSKFLQRYLKPSPDLLQNAQHVFDSFLDSENRNGFHLEAVVKSSKCVEEIVPDSKDHLKAIDVQEKMEMNDELSPKKGLSKFMRIVQKALDGGGAAVNELLIGLGIQMKLFDESLLNVVDDFMHVRKKFSETERFFEFNFWLMSFHGNEDYHDFNHFMDRHCYPSLITFQENCKSEYNELESQMYWSGILEDKKNFL